MQLVAVVAGAAWYATGSLYSAFTATEYSIWSFEHRGLTPPWHAIAACSGVLTQDLAKAGALARCSWFTRCLGLFDMPLPTPTEHLPPQSTRYSSCSSRGLHAHGVQMQLLKSKSSDCRWCCRQYLVAAGSLAAWGCLICPYPLPQRIYSRGALDSGVFWGGFGLRGPPVDRDERLSQSSVGHGIGTS